MTSRPPNVRAHLAVATAAAVATALAGMALLVVGRDARPPARPGPGGDAPVASPAAPAASPSSSLEPTARGPGRLLVLTGGPWRPRATIRDLARPGEAVALPLPVGAVPLAAIAVAPDGRLAAVTQDGRAWEARTARPGGPGDPTWHRLPIGPAALGLPDPVLGAAWRRDGSALQLLGGDPGSGVMRTAVATFAFDGTPTTIVAVPRRADGPALAALPGGGVAYIGRDLRDRTVVVRIRPDGAFEILPAAGSRWIAAGADLVAIAEDAAVMVGRFADLERGVLPAERLPLAGAAGIGAVAVSPDGTAIAVVRPEEGPAPSRVDVLRRAGDAWVPAGPIPLEADPRSAIVAWLP